MTPPRSRQRPEKPAPQRSEWLVAILAAVGLTVAGYLAWTKWTSAPALFCTAGSGCDVVQASRYAVFLGLPTAAWGAALYAAIGALALLGLPPRRWLAAFGLAAAGLSFSLYLTYLELFVIRALCGYCLVSQATALALVGLLLWRRPAATGRRSAVRPARVVTVGAVAAVGAVLFGAAVFAIPEPKQAAAYQEALARHLKASGAVFYGAYW